MARRHRTDEELRAVAEHLYYEVGMFLNLAKVLATGALGEGSLNNAVLESFTVHPRVLLEFLFGENLRDDDVVADDFLGSEGRWANLAGEIPPILNAVRQRVGKEIAHLTYARVSVTPEAKHWHFLEIAAAMQSVLERLLAVVPRTRLGPSWPAVGERG
jgi:hypothetical protein